MNAVLLDAGVIVAALNKRDGRHSICLKFLEETRQDLVTCEAVITESCHLLARISGAPQAVLANVLRGRFQIKFQLTRALAPLNDLMQKYSDLPIDFADACLIQMADELSTGDILTLDSDFLHYRWRRNRRFNLLIPIE